MNQIEMIQSCIDYIEKNLKAEITAAELAERVGFSVFHFYRLFQAETGMPVMQYILKRRLLNAIYEMAQGRKKIDVAQEYGFDTYAGFYKAFQREIGFTPASFLKNCKAKKPYRINLMKEEHIMVTHKKIAEILIAWGLQKESITDIYYEGSGNKNENACYVGSEYVIKFTANYGKLKKHMELTAAIEGIGLYTASLIKTEDGSDYVKDGELYFYLTKRLQGRQMAAGEMYTNDYITKARFVGEIIGQLHLALQKVEAAVENVNLQETVKNWALPRVKSVMNLSENFCKNYEQEFERLFDKLPTQIIHRDPNPANIICNEDKWGFIDFELSEQNVRIYDICYAATAILSESFSNMDDIKGNKWIEIYKNIVLGYDSVAKLHAEEREAIPYVLLANQFVCVAWFSEQEKYQDICETNKRMTEWLVEHFQELSVENA